MCVFSMKYDCLCEKYNLWKRIWNIFIEFFKLIIEAHGEKVMVWARRSSIHVVRVAQLLMSTVAKGETWCKWYTADLADEEFVSSLDWISNISPTIGVFFFFSSWRHQLPNVSHRAHTRREANSARWDEKTKNDAQREDQIERSSTKSDSVV